MDEWKHTSIFVYYLIKKELFYYEDLHSFSLFLFFFLISFPPWYLYYCVLPCFLERMTERKKIKRKKTR